MQAKVLLVIVMSRSSTLFKGRRWIWIITTGIYVLGLF